jgi:hypothetical protein
MADSPMPAVVAAYLLTALSFLIVLSRMLFRLLKHEEFKLDDYFISASTAIYAAYTGTFIVAVSCWGPAIRTESPGLRSCCLANPEIGIPWNQHQSNRCDGLEQ